MSGVPGASDLTRCRGSPATRWAELALAALLACACSKGNPSKKTLPGCTSSAACAEGLVCVSGVCGPCSLDSQCEAISLTEQCTPGVQRCQLRNCFGTQCKLNADCSLGDFCVQGLCLDPRSQQTGPDACTVVNCTKSADCASGQICDITNQVCVLNLGCATNSDCPTNEECNVGAATCQPACTAATAYQICGLEQQCYDGLCVGCVQSADCGTGLTCDLTTHECVGFDGCLSDSDCAPPLVCNPLTSQCTADLGPCLSDEKCPSGTTCQVQTGECVPATCTPDQYAPNQTLMTAAALPTGTTSNLVVCNEEPSYFSLALQNGDTLNVIVDVSALLDFDIALLDPTGATLAESTGDSVETIAPEDGTFYIRTESSQPNVDYGLQVSVTQGTACNPYPPSNTYATAAIESVGDLDQICESDAGPCGPPTVCPGGQGWFVLAIPNGQTLTATLTTTAANGPLDLYLYDSNGQTLLDSSLTATDTQSVSSSAFSGGSGYVEVVPDQPGTGNTYSLQFLLTSP